jgi:hypothetical protein
VVQFARDGTQRLRVQPRIGQAAIARILLSGARATRPTADFEATADDIVLTPDAAMR